MAPQLKKLQRSTQPGLGQVCDVTEQMNGWAKTDPLQRQQQQQQQQQKQQQQQQK